MKGLSPDVGKFSINRGLQGTGFSFAWECYYKRVPR